MRILFVIDSLGPGGAERSLHELIPCFERERIACEVVALEGVQPGVEISPSERSYRARVLRTTSGPARVRELRALVAHEQPDIVHTSLFRSDVVGRLAAWRMPARVVTSLVNTSYEPARLHDRNVRPVRLEAARIVDGWTARHLTDHFHAITHAVKASAVARLHISPERVTVIERGRDTRRLGEPGPQRRAEARARLKLRDTDAVIVTVGRQDPQKGQVALVDAFDVVAAEISNARLLIVGRSGHASAALEARVRSSPSASRIELLGHRDDVPEILAAADVFAFPSRYEGLGGAVIEAMALALPVVASDLPALREVVREAETGLLVPSGRADAFAQALLGLMTDSKRAHEMGARGRNRFLELFTLERSARRMIEMFENALVLP